MTGDGLRREDGFAGRGDAVYEALLRAHHGLGDPDSAALDARLVLILANQIGDLGVLAAAIRLARESLGHGERAPPAIDGSGPRTPSSTTIQEPRGPDGRGGAQ